MTPPNPHPSPQNDIMIVDDNPANLKLLEDMLEHQGHDVRSFPLGRLALAAAAKSPPDLILLDINMPEMNGYEVCERLKSAMDLADIPVIFLSALNELQDKVAAFRSGAVDYISKPFQFEEVQARVETHLKLHNLQQALKAYNHQLEEVVAARTHELAEANERLTILDHSKSEFLKLISHEFRTPLNGLLGAGELILDGMPVTEENVELGRAFQRSRSRILSIIDDALLLTHIDVKGEQFSSDPLSLQAILDHALQRTADFSASCQVHFSCQFQEGDFVHGDAELLTRAFQALFETAVKFSLAGKNVEVIREAVSEFPRITIVSRGKTIPDHLITNFFDVFAIAESSTSGGDLGLGPALAQRIFSLFGARVTVANREPAGIQFTVVWEKGVR